MKEQPGEIPNNTQKETPVVPEEKAKTVDFSRLRDENFSPKDLLHIKITENNREVTSFVGKIQKEMKREGFDCEGALEKAKAMIKETEDLEADNKGTISTEDISGISTRLMLLNGLVSELELEKSQELREQIKNSGEGEVKQEQEKVIFPSEEPKNQDIMQEVVVPEKNIDKTESEAQELEENVIEESEKKEKEEEDSKEQEIVDNFLRRAARLLACKDVLSTERELSDAQKVFLSQEFPNQDVSAISRENLLEMIEVREEKLIEMAERGARIAGMRNIMSGFRLIDKGFPTVTKEMNDPMTFDKGLDNLDKMTESTLNIARALRELHEMRENKNLSEESEGSLDKYKKGVIVELEGDKNIKWEKKGERTDSVKISGRDVDNIQRKDTNDWFFLKRLLEMAGTSNHFDAIKEADSKSNKVSRSRKNLGNGRYRFDIEWEDATKVKRLLIITVDLGVEVRGSFWERNDIRKKRDVPVTAEEYWEEVKKEDEIKIEEREPEDIGDNENEDNNKENAGALKDFVRKGFAGGEYQDYLFCIAISDPKDGAFVIDALDAKFNLDDKAIRKFIETLASFVRKEPQEITVKEVQNVVSENFSNETNNLLGELGKLDVLTSELNRKESVSAEDKDQGKKLLENIRDIATKNMKNERLEGNEKKLAKVILEQLREAVGDVENVLTEGGDISESKQKEHEEEATIENRETEQMEAEEKDEQRESLERLDGEKDVEEGCVYKIFANGNYEIRMKNGIIHFKTEGNSQERILDKDFLLVAGGRDAMLPLAGTTALSNRKPKENELPPVPMRQVLLIGKVEKIEKQFEKNNNRK